MMIFTKEPQYYFIVYYSPIILDELPDMTGLSAFGKII